MKKLLFTITLLLTVTGTFAQQTDTTETTKEKRDSLKASGVMAQRTLVKIQAEKLTYDIENDIDSKSMTMLEMLRKIPKVTVDANGSIRVNGSSSFKVYVDGRLDQMLSENPTSMFRVMPASGIKSVDVVTNPGARYDAEGVGGVIDIKTLSGSRKAIADGIYGSVNAGATTLENVYGSVNMNARAGKWTVGASLQPSRNRTAGIEAEMARDAQAYSSREMYRQEIINGSLRGTLSASYEADTLNLFTASLGLSHSPNRGRLCDGHFATIRHAAGSALGSTWSPSAEGSIWGPSSKGSKGSKGNTSNAGSSQTEGTGMAEGEYSYDMSAIFHESWSDVKGGLDWQHRFKSHPERMLTLSWQLSDTPARTRDTTFISRISGTLPFESDNVILVKDSESLENTFQADFTTPTGKNQSLIAGAKLILRHFQTDATDGIIDSEYSYRSSIGAAYAEYTGTFKRLTLKGGARYEHTWQEYHQTGQNFSLDYGNLVPNASLQYDLGKRSNFCLSYNLRIRRPGIGYLRPYINRTSPNSISYGNPDLQAENTHRIDLSYNLASPKWIISAKLGGRFCNNGISEYATLNGSILETTYGNILKFSAEGANVYASWSPSGKTRVFLSMDGAYQSYRSEALDLRNSGVGVSGLIGLQQSLPWELRLNSTLSASTRTYSFQRWTKGPAILSAYLAKTFLDNRLSVSLSVISNLSRGMMETTVHTKGTDFVETSKSRVHGRYLGAGLAYTFGRKRISVKQTARTIVNDDIVGER